MDKKSVPGAFGILDITPPAVLIEFHSIVKPILLRPIFHFIKIFLQTPQTWTIYCENYEGRSQICGAKPKSISLNMCEVDPRDYNKFACHVGKDTFDAVAKLPDCVDGVGIMYRIHLLDDLIPQAECTSLPDNIYKSECISPSDYVMVPLSLECFLSDHRGREFQLYEKFCTLNLESFQRDEKKAGKYVDLSEHWHKGDVKVTVFKTRKINT